MAVLNVEKGKQQGLEIEILEDGAPMVLGRDASADIVLEDERASRQHARLVRHRGEWIIEDLGSRNGVLHRGQAVRRAAVRAGEVFQIGSTVLKLLEDQHPDPLPGGEVLGARLQRLVRSEAGVLSYQGQQLAMDRPVRIDLTHPRRPLGAPGSPSGSPDGPQLIAGIAQAAEVAGRLQHPAVLPLLRSEAPNEHGGASVVLRWSEGRRLSDLCDDLLTAPLGNRLRFFRRLAEAVLERSARPLCYSLALSHVLVDVDSAPQVAALELSALLSLLRGQVLDLPEYPPYLAPEAQATGARPAWPLLVYNLGAIGYHLLTGEPPMGGGSVEEILEKHRTLAPAPANVIRPEISREVSDLLSRMLEKDPSARPGTAEEVMAGIPLQPEVREGKSEVREKSEVGGRKSEVQISRPPAIPKPRPATRRPPPPPPPPRGLPLGVKLIVWPAIWAGLVVGLRYLTRLLLEN